MASVRNFTWPSFNLLGNEVMASLNYSYQLGELCNYQRQVVVTLMENQSGAWYAEAVDRAVIRKLGKN